MTALTIGSLFSGIGGLELGLERGIGNGAHTIWQVEQSDYCRAVLAKHWPDATRYDDVRTVGRATLAPVDVICGGFPCQDISLAGQRAGIAGARSGLWGEFARLVRELRPGYVVVENVAALVGDGLDVVLADLAAVGYDAEWSVVSACAVGAPQLRERLFLLAYPGEFAGPQASPRVGPLGSGQYARHDDRGRTWNGRAAVSRVVRESDVVRVADGVPFRVERSHALGNAVVPQVAEVVGRLIAEREAQAVAA